MRYTKKPVTIEAEQWFPEKDVTGVHWEPRKGDDPAAYVITAHDQRAYLAPGDWIIPEPMEGRYYPCKPDIFDQTYSEALPEGFPDFTPADYLAEQQKDFPSALAHAINVFSKENGSDTPDWLLAEYLCRCLDNFDLTIQARETELWPKRVDDHAPDDCPLEAIHEQGVEALQALTDAEVSSGFTIGQGFQRGYIPESMAIDIMNGRLPRAPIGEDDQD